MIEEWKIITINDKYEVSNIGRIKYRKLQRILKPVKHSAGYRTVKLTFENKKQKPYYIHRLVAEAFIPNPENKPQVNHINGIKDDNRLENLEWVTSQENSIHARDSGLCQDKLENWSTLLNYDKVREIIELLKKGLTQIEIGKLYGVSNITISDIARGVSWPEINRDKIYCPNNRPKLTKYDGIKIKELYSTGKYSQTDIGNMFNVNRRLISDILNDKYIYID